MATEIHHLSKYDEVASFKPISPTAVRVRIVRRGRKVFLRILDLKQAREMYTDLKRRGFKPW